MNWEQVEKVAKIAMDELRGRTNNKPYTKHSGPLIGGIAPHDPDGEESYYIQPPNLVSTEFVVEITGKNPIITVSGDAMRPIRAQPNTSESLKTMLEPITFEPKNFRVVAGSQQVHWETRSSTKLREGSRKYQLMDPGLRIEATGTVDNKDNVTSVKIVFKNTTTKNQGVLYDFHFKLEMTDCKIVKPDGLKDDRDVPMVVATVNAVAYIKDDNKIELQPYGIWDQEREITVSGPTFDSAIEKPFDGNLSEYHDLFVNAAKIVTKAMKTMITTSDTYHKFQYDLRGIIYEQMVKGWKDNKLRAVIDNAPTASGKSEVNFDAAIVASLVRKKQVPDGDCGTVAIISEPIRALTAEQLERLFKLLAFVNEQLPENERVTMGFFMGTQEGRGIPYEPSAEVTIKQVPITNCPFCENIELKLEYIQNQGRLIAKCENCKRNYPWIYLTLRECEAFLPNIVVATLDKLCYDEGHGFGVHAFFGREYTRCTNPICRRAVSVTSSVLRGEGKCKFCYKPVSIDRLKKSKFSIFVLDEAHSFRGSLGSNAGLYTSTELQLAKNILSESPLVIASTATVKKAAELLHHLTGSLKDETVILPNIENKKSDEKKYFKKTGKPHRKFIFNCSNTSNRVSIPRAIGAIKDAWDKIRESGDPEHLPQIVFTKKRQNADNLNNAIQILGEEEQRRLIVKTIHGEHDKREVKEALRQIENNEIDVLFVTLDLISLGIDIPSISIVHFDGIPDDFAKFVQAYGRSARGRGENDCGLIFTWLRMNIPGEAYYLEHFRDLFIYKDRLMPIIPINKWFPHSIRSYMPAAAFQYGFFTDQKASMFSPAFAARQLTNSVYKNELQNFITRQVLNNSQDISDDEIAQRYTLLGLQDIESHIPKQNISSYKKHTDLLKGILPVGIRSHSEETTIIPHQMDRTLMSIKVEKSLLSAGFTEYELGIGEES
jgi:hypothetical protein